MDKKVKNRVESVRKHIKKIPFFKIENLLAIDSDKSYLRVLLSRMSHSEEIIRIKRGLYVHRDYITDVQIKNKTDEYYEFLACSIFEGAYLSLGYVLSEYGVLSESVYGYSLVSSKKPYKVVNKFGSFVCHSIKNKLFIGYKIIKKSDYIIKKASLAKSLFDFLYLRKNILTNKENVSELRLNLDVFKNKDKIEVRKYIKLEGSKKMIKIFGYLDF